ncbi:B-box domain protein 31 [Cardamine amara subsp. amara]|uniref:B-box domain protein 31 n=1 Tax=Cardamine amara subsp. amara TaxID=228776 RepID=A0ABD1AG82_CARAN
MGKKCDLCNGVAKMYCESDQASLCCDCDGKVHGANFLVAKHTRCLLCSSCQSLTPWKATGLRLGPTFTVCDSCVALKNGGGGGVSSDRSLLDNRGQEINSFDSEEDRIREDDGDGAESYDDDEDAEEDEDDEYSDDYEDEDEDEEEDEVDDEEAENQVVPWSAVAQPPPMMTSSSSDGGSVGLVTKRTRENSDLLYSDDEMGSSSAQESNYSRPLKRLSRDEPAFKSTAVVNSIVRLADESSSSPSSSSLIFGISKARRDLSR